MKKVLYMLSILALFSMSICIFAKTKVPSYLKNKKYYGSLSFKGESGDEKKHLIKVYFKGGFTDYIFGSKGPHWILEVDKKTKYYGPLSYFAHKDFVRIKFFDLMKKYKSNLFKNPQEDNKLFELRFPIKAFQEKHVEVTADLDSKFESEDYGSTKNLQVFKKTSDILGKLDIQKVGLIKQ